MAGRPRKEEPNKKEKHISIRVTKEEYDAIKKICYEKNMTFRDVLLHEIPKKT